MKRCIKKRKAYHFLVMLHLQQLLICIPDKLTWLHSKIVVCVTCFLLLVVFVDEKANLVKREMKHF